MLPLLIDLPDAMAALRSGGIDARLAWHGDHQDSLVLIAPDWENLARLEGWIGTQIGTRRNGTRGD